MVLYIRQYVTYVLTSDDVLVFCYDFCVNFKTFQLHLTYSFTSLKQRVRSSGRPKCRQRQSLFTCIYLPPLCLCQCFVRVNECVCVCMCVHCLKGTSCLASQDQHIRPKFVLKGGSALKQNYFSCRERKEG